MGNPDEIAELQALSQEMAALEQSRYEPRCVGRMFARPRPCELVFTMQAWIDLSEFRSPLLSGELPSAEEAQQAMEALAADWEPETGIELMVAMEQALSAISEGFAMILPMSPEKPETLPDQGFGLWLTTMRLLVTTAHIGWNEALALRVGAAFALLASVRDGQTWQAGGVTYRLRDFDEEVPRG